MANKKCKEQLETTGSDIINTVMIYEVQSEAAIGNLIGFPSKTKLNKYKRGLKDATDKKRQKYFRQKIKVESNKYKAHKKLFDYMLKYFMDSGEISNYDTSPSDMSAAWGHYFSKMLYGLVSPESISQGTHRIQSIYNRVKTVVKQREKMMKNKKINNWEVALMTPDVIMMKADRFGIVSKVVNNILRVSDDEMQMASRFVSKFKKTTDKYTYTLNQLISGKSVKDRIVNINNAAMGGLTGFHIKMESKFGHKDYTGGDEVMIVGEEVDDYGVEKWRVKVKLSDEQLEEAEEGASAFDEETTAEDITYSDDVYLLPKTELNESESDVYEGLIKKYTDELKDDILHGQVRYLKPKVLPPRDDEGFWVSLKEAITDLSEIAEDDKIDEVPGKFIGRKIAEMARDKKWSEENDSPRVTPGVHTVRKGGYDYTYVMKKDGEGTVSAARDGEKYLVYLLNKKKVGSDEVVNFIKGEEYTQEEINSVIQEGFYKASEDFGHGKVMHERTGMEYRGADRRFRNFSYMEEQPNEDALLSSKGKGFTFWENIARHRNIYSEVYDDVNARVNKFTVNLQKSRAAIEKLLKSRGVEAATIDKYLEEFEAIGGIKTKMFSTKDGDMWSINSFMQRRTRNYSPSMYITRSLDEMIDAKVSALSIKLERMKDTEGVSKDAIEELSDALEHLKGIKLSLIENPDPESLNRLVNGERLVHMKHLTDWTDMTKRRKDGDVPYDYLKHTYMIIARNELMMNASNAMHKLLLNEQHTPDGTIEYLLNRLKMGVGDPDTRATGIWGRDRGHAKVAELLNNRVPKSLRLGVEFTPESVEKLVKWVGAVPTMRFLGAGSAVGNRTQIVNMIIAEGFGTWTEASKLLSDPDFKSKADEIINNTGVLNLLTVFKDIMLQDGELDFWDFGLLPGTVIPTKNMTDFIRLLAKGRDGFIKSKDKDINKFLKTMYLKSKGKAREDLAYLIKLEKERGSKAAKKEMGFNKEEMDKGVSEMKGAMYDIFTATKEESQDRELMEARFRKLVVNISESKLKKMVSWKLSWWREGAGKSIFTFTGGEARLRAETAMMALIGAHKRGLLGGKHDSMADEDIDIFMTDKAVKIARDAVYNTQFGMTPVYLGELFNGLGRAIWQYKSYPTQQMAHDYKILKKFTDGSNSKGESIYRMVDAVWKAGVGSKGMPGIVRTAFTMQKQQYDPKNEELDHDALAAVRLIFTRFAASIIATAIGLVPVLGMLLRSLGGRGFAWSLMRSGENPAFGLLARTITWGSLIAMGGEDDDRLEELLGNAQYLLLPVWIGMLIRDGYTAVEHAEWFSEL